MANSDVKELKAQWKTEVELPEFTLKDVAAHNTKNDTLIVIHGQGLFQRFCQRKKKKKQLLTFPSIRYH